MPIEFSAGLSCAWEYMRVVADIFHALETICREQRPQVRACSWQEKVERFQGLIGGCCCYDAQAVILRCWWRWTREDSYAEAGAERNSRICNQPPSMSISRSPNGKLYSNVHGIFMWLSKRFNFEDVHFASYISTSST